MKKALGSRPGVFYYFQFEICELLLFYLYLVIIKTSIAMAKILFRVDFKGSLEIPQRYLKLTRTDAEGNVLSVDPDDYSPETLKENIESGDFKIQLVETLVNGSIRDKEYEIDYKEDTGF